MKKQKKSKKKKIVLIIIIIMMILGGAGYYGYDKFIKKDTKKEVKVIKKINNFGYKLEENKPKLYKKYFNELDDILTQDEVNYDEYAKIVAKLFITDFYTLSNKTSKNDIGGLDFIKDSMKDNFIDEARSTFYRYIKINSSEQSLPEVSEILEVNVQKTTFTYSDQTTDEDAYKVNIKWDYKVDLGYEKEANMILVKEDKKLYIIEMD